MIKGTADGLRKRSVINILEIDMMNHEDCDVKMQDRLTMFAIAVVLLATAVAIIGSSKKDRTVLSDHTIDIEYTDPLPEIEFKQEILPEILPPLFEEPLPPLQGEV